MPADRAPARVHCARCFDVVWTAHPWESVACRCGAVTVSGVPWRPRVDWHASAPGGWSFVEETPVAADEGRDATGDDG